MIALRLREVRLLFGSDELLSWDGQEEAEVRKSSKHCLTSVDYPAFAALFAVVIWPSSLLAVTFTPFATRR